MPNDFISPDRTISTAILAPKIINIANITRTLRREVEEAVAMAKHNFDDSNPNAVDFTDFEQIAGLDPGEGHTVYTMIDGLMMALRGEQQNDAGKTISERIGG